ncbi:MAG: hypothetical protein AAF125_18460, partial [Chloroflexota bacterium]
MTLGNQFRVRTNDGRQVSTYLAPITHTLISGTNSGSANTIYTVGQSAALVKRLAVVNTSGSSVNLTLHAVPDSGSIATGNTELNEYAIAADTSVDLTEIIGGYYQEGTTLEV